MYIYVNDLYSIKYDDIVYSIYEDLNIMYILFILLIKLYKSQAMPKLKVIIKKYNFEEM